jgi:hypothetical protein
VDLLGGVVEVVRSRFVEASVLDDVGRLFEAIGLSSRVVEDDLESMLVKNLEVVEGV